MFYYCTHKRTELDSIEMAQGNFFLSFVTVYFVDYKYMLLFRLAQEINNNCTASEHLFFDELLKKKKMQNKQHQNMVYAGSSRGGFFFRGLWSEFCD